MRKWIYYLIVAIGLLQIIGFIFQSPVIKGLGAATASAPLPIVFTEVKGVETFASEFTILYTDAGGVEKEMEISPAVYSKLKGPYNRRNVYGAAIAYGPVLPENLREAVLSYAICKKVLITEIGLSQNISNVSIRVKTKTAGRNDVWILAPECEK